MFRVKETNIKTNKSEFVKKMVHTSRGWFIESKTWNTEKGAKIWIAKRKNELLGTPNESTWIFEIVKAN